MPCLETSLCSAGWLWLVGWWLMLIWCEKNTVSWLADKPAEQSELELSRSVNTLNGMSLIVSDAYILVTS